MSIKKLMFCNRSAVIYSEIRNKIIILIEVSWKIHWIMKDSNNFYAFICNTIKIHMFFTMEAHWWSCEFMPSLPQIWILCRRDKTLLQFVQIFICLVSISLWIGVFPNIIKINIYFPCQFIFRHIINSFSLSLFLLPKLSDLKSNIKINIKKRLIQLINFRNFSTFHRSTG